MTMIKRGMIKSEVIVSSLIYSCEKCGNTEIICESEDFNKKCSKCENKMGIISAKASSLEDKENDEDNSSSSSSSF